MDYQKTYLNTDDTPPMLYAWECQTCFAMVTNRVKHDEWHHNSED